MRISTSLLCLLLSALPWLCDALPQSPLGGGVYIAELGLVYNKGVLTDPITGKISNNNRNLGNANWGYYKPTLGNVPRVPRRRENIQPRRVSSNLMGNKPAMKKTTTSLNSMDMFAGSSSKIQRRPTQIQSLPIKPAISRFGSNQLVQRPQVVNRIGASGNFNTGTIQRNRVNVNTNPLTNNKLPILSNVNNAVKTNNNFLKTSYNNKPTIFGAFNRQDSLQRLGSSNTPNMFSQQNAQNFGIQKFSKPNNLLTPQNSLVNPLKTYGGLQNRVSIFGPPNKAQIFGGPLPANQLPNTVPIATQRLHPTVQRLPGIPALVPQQQTFVPQNNPMFRPQYVYGPHVYIPGVWSAFTPPPVVVTPKPTTTTTTTTTTTPPPTTEAPYWNMYDWNYADPYAQPSLNPKVIPAVAPTQRQPGVAVAKNQPSQTTPSSLTSAPNVFIPLATQPGATVDPTAPIAVTVTPTIPLNVSINTTSAATTTNGTTVSTTMSAKQRAHYMKALLKPPFKRKNYEEICIHYNRTNPNRTSHAFGPINQDCGSYVKCNVFNGFFFPNETRCGFGLWFDTGTGSCTDADAISKPCIYNPCAQLQGGTQVNIPYPGTCGGFFACEGGSATAEMCDAGINFDHMTGMCCVPPAFCPCLDNPEGVTPDYQLQNFMQQHFPQFHDHGVPVDRKILPPYDPLSVTL